MKVQIPAEQPDTVGSCSVLPDGSDGSTLNIGMLEQSEVGIGAEVQLPFALAVDPRAIVFLYLAEDKLGRLPTAARKLIVVDAVYSRNGRNVTIHAVDRIYHD